MANVIKKVKIKKEDGTFTDYIPIGVDAINVITEDGMSIENKLDKKPYYFNNIAEMKMAEYLIEGDYIITSGYYEANDGGGAEYKIINGNYIDDGGSYHQLNNNLFAELIIKNEINVKQFGAYGDGQHDDTLFIQRALNTNYYIVFNGLFKITDSLNIDVGLHKGIIGKNAKILCDFTNKTFSAFIMFNSLYDDSHSGRYGTVGSFKIENIIVTEIHEQQITEIEHYGAGIQLNNGSAGIEINNCSFSNFKYGLYAPNSSSGVYNIKTINCKITKNDYNIYLGCLASNDCGENFRFFNCSFSTARLGNYINNDMFVNFMQCSFDYNLGNTLIIKDSANVSLVECHIEWYSSTPLFIVEYNGSIKCTNCIFIRTAYIDGLSNEFFFETKIGDGLPSLIFESCSFNIYRAYEKLCNSQPYFKFVNCNRGGYNPSQYTQPYYTINLQNAFNYNYPLSYNSGLSRNFNRVKVTANEQKNSNALYLPFDYENKDAKITLNVISSVNMNLPISIGNGIFKGDGLTNSYGVIEHSVNTLIANTQTTISFHHKFRKGVETTPYLMFNLAELSTGAWFEILDVTIQFL